MRKVNATFYTTFYVNAHDEEYQEFQRDFISWFGHGTGITFPKYSILGYDTGAFFLLPSSGEPVGRGARFNGDRQHQGIQSNFYFRPAYDNREISTVISSILRPLSPPMVAPSASNPCLV